MNLCRPLDDLALFPTSTGTGSIAGSWRQNGPSNRPFSWHIASTKCKKGNIKVLLGSQMRSYLSYSSVGPTRRLTTNSFPNDPVAGENPIVALSAYDFRMPRRGNNRMVIANIKSTFFTL
jgi:hypothetical protein